MIEMVYDEAGQPVDYRFVDVSPSFEAQTGLEKVWGHGNMGEGAIFYFTLPE